MIVQPATVIAWQRKRFCDHWAKLSNHGKSGRPPVPKEIIDLIRMLSAANICWGSPRIVGELRKLGIDVAKSTVEKYRVRLRKPPSPTWRSFLNNHAKEMVSIDFLIVPTVRFRMLYVLVILSHRRRKVVHFNVTAHPTAHWTGQQIIEAFPWESAPKYLIRDRDGIYESQFGKRDCLDHVVVLNERQLKRILTTYFSYYHRWRTHLSLEMDSPSSRPVQLPGSGIVVQFPELGGLHHHYERIAA